MIDSNREEFEKLPEIASILKGNDCRFLGDGYRVYSDNELQCYLDGAWYAFQVQQKKLDCCREENKAYIEKVDEVLTYLRHTDFRECKESILFNILKGNKDETGLN